MKLEDELLRVKWMGTYTGPDYESNWGFKSAIQFCIDRREDGWVLQEFIDHKKNLEEKYKNVEGPYKDGFLYGLNLNIKELREMKTNE